MSAALETPLLPFEGELPEREPDICRRKHGGNHESEAANGRANKKVWQERVAGFAVERGLAGITADEVAEHFSVAHNTVAPRCSELVAAGVLVPLFDGQGKRVRRVTRAGCSAGVLIHFDVRTLGRKRAIET